MIKIMSLILVFLFACSTSVEPTQNSINFDQILKKSILNSSLTIFKGCAHNVHLEKINEFNNRIQTFLLKPRS